MEDISRKRRIAGMTWLFSFAYLISYVTRINYGAVLVEMEAATGFSRDLLSMAATGLFICYGVGQVVSGIIGDHFSPKKLVVISFSVTTLMNLMIPVCKTPYGMLAVWCVNGFAQAFMWPPMVRMMTYHMNQEEYVDSVAKVSYGSCIGTIVVYLSAPLLISLFNWKAVFIASAVCGALMLVFWLRFAPDAAPEKKEKTETSVPVPTKKAANILAPVMLMIMAAIILQGIIRDGITTWMPTYIADTYNLGNGTSILSGAILPIFSILSFKFATILHAKWMKNPLTCAAAFFGFSTVGSVVLWLLSGRVAVLSIVLSAIVTGCMHGVNLMLIGMIPSYFKNSGHVSTVSGMLNCCTYIGSSVSTYGVAILSKNLGWDFTLLVWVGVTAVGTVSCVLAAKPWKQYKETI